MKLCDSSKISLVLIGFVATVMVAGRSANADFTCESSTKMPNVNGSDDDVMPSLSRDGLSLYISSIRPGNLGGIHDLWMATRSSTNEDFGTPVNLGAPVSSPYFEDSPYISADGTELYFTDGYFVVGSHPYLRPGGFGVGDVWVSTRATTDDEWGSPTNLGATVNSASYDGSPCLSADGLTLFFDSMRAGGFGGVDVWMATRPAISDAWGPAVNLGPIVNSSQDDVAPRILSDGLTLLFTSNREGNYDLWATRRATISDPWGPPVKLGSEINTDLFEVGPTFSPDGSTVYLCRGEGGNWDLWQVEILPAVDFNGDGIVDAADMCIMVDHWGEDYTLCDIAPPPFGDGIVDVQDLIVLSEHLFEEVDDPTLVAHWALDETEGDIASDSANDNDGTVYGDPVWQPEGGVVEGALQLDGIDDYVSTPFVLNPADGKFSVFAWIKGGAPGQVILSQADGANWLLADPVEGNLMTELKGSGRTVPPPLLSEFVITDDNWHRIGLVWDGSHRTLYADDVAVAEDTQDNLKASENGLYIGTAKAMESGTFWSGLIDDVRIYNRAVNP